MKPREPNAAMTDEEIIAATVGERRIHGRTVHLAEYDPAWPEAFERRELAQSPFPLERIRQM